MNPLHRSVCRATIDVYGSDTSNASLQHLENAWSWFSADPFCGIRKLAPSTSTGVTPFHLVAPSGKKKGLFAPSFRDSEMLVRYPMMRMGDNQVSRLPLHFWRRILFPPPSPQGPFPIPPPLSHGTPDLFSSDSSEDLPSPPSDMDSLFDVSNGLNAIPFIDSNPEGSSDSASPRYFSPNSPPHYSTGSRLELRTPSQNSVDQRASTSFFILQPTHECLRP